MTTQVAVYLGFTCLALALLLFFMSSRRLKLADTLHQRSLLAIGTGPSSDDLLELAKCYRCWQLAFIDNNGANHGKPVATLASRVEWLCRGRFEAQLGLVCSGQPMETFGEQIKSMKLAIGVQLTSQAVGRVMEMRSRDDEAQGRIAEQSTGEFQIPTLVGA
jgi:hypothetical protein